MTVGEALNEARQLAGLSVEELSERTRIRGTVIRSIEQDDYDACGGDLYARGYVRAIAGAVGIDARPLIREFDLRRVQGPPGAAPPGTAQTPPGLPGVAEATPVPEPPARQAPVPPGRLDTTRYDIPVVTANPAVTSYDLPRVSEVLSAAEPPAAAPAATGYPAAEPPALTPLAPGPAPGPGAAPAPTPEPAPLPAAPLPAAPPGGAKTRFDLTAVPEEPSPEAPEDLMAAGYDLGPAETPASANAGTQILPALGFGQAPPPAGSAWPAPGQGGAAGKNRRGLFSVVAVASVAVAGTVGFFLASRGGSTAAGAAASMSAAAAARASASAAASQASASAAAQASASAAAAAQASASASARDAARRVTSLPVTSVVAFGPDGTADGDDPGSAADAIAARPPHPWTTQWYATPTFGMLKHGTGLLLDLGGKVTVTTVSLDLSRYQGADLELRVGNVEALRNLRVVATADDVSGTLRLTVHQPVAARYLLIWFTRLPPDGAGHYQGSVSHVSVVGRR